MADSPSPRFGQQLQAHKKMNGGGGGVGGHYNTNNHRSGGLLHQRQAQSCRIPMAMTRYIFQIYGTLSVPKFILQISVTFRTIHRVSNVEKNR